MKKLILLCLIGALLCAWTAPALAEELTLSFIGDCSLGEAIQFRGHQDVYTQVLQEKGYDWPFSLVRDILDADDFTFANLEVVLTDRAAHVEKRFPLSGTPANAQVLLRSGVDAVNTVNNHCFDFYAEGYQDTMNALDAIDFPHFGSVYVGKGNEQDVLLRAEVKGVKLGAVGASYPQDNDLKWLAARIEALRDEGCQLVVVSLHWGQETNPKHLAWQAEFAKKLIDAGADIIWGHHAHVIQPIQFYKGGVILFSTGNFTFGTISATVDRDTGIFQITYDLAGNAPALSQLRVIPCTTTLSPDYRPYELTEPADRARVFKKLMDKRVFKTMINLPDSFAETGIVRFENGIPVE